MNKLTSTVLLAGSPLQNADLFYAAPFSGSDPIVFMKSGRRRCLVVDGSGTARRLFRGRLQVFTPLKYCSTAVRHALRIGVCCCANFVSARCECRVLFVGIVQRLEAAGVRVTVCNDPIFPARDRAQELAVSESHNGGGAAQTAGV